MGALLPALFVILCFFLSSTFETLFDFGFVPILDFFAFIWTVCGVGPHLETTLELLLSRLRLLCLHLGLNLLQSFSETWQIVT